MFLAHGLLTVQPAAVARREDDAWILGVAECLVSSERVGQNAPSDAEAAVMMIVNLGHGRWVIKGMVFE